MNNNQDGNLPNNARTEESRPAHWVAPKLTLLSAGAAEAGTTVGPDGPETGNS